MYVGRTKYAIIDNIVIFQNITGSIIVYNKYLLKIGSYYYYNNWLFYLYFKFKKNLTWNYSDRQM